jgi:hypothetical protein
MDVIAFVCISGIDSCKLPWTERTLKLFVTMYTHVILKVTFSLEGHLTFCTSKRLNINMHNHMCCDTLFRVELPLAIVRALLVNRIFPADIRRSRIYSYHILTPFYFVIEL